MHPSRRAVWRCSTTAQALHASGTCTSMRMCSRTTHSRVETVRAKLGKYRKSAGDDDSATRLLRIERCRACPSSAWCVPPKYARRIRKPPPFASLASPTRRPGGTSPSPYHPLGQMSPSDSAARCASASSTFIALVSNLEAKKAIRETIIYKRTELSNRKLIK